MRFGKRISALEFDRILRRKNREIAGERVTRAIDRHLPLFHRFEQRGLRPRRCPIDFVDEQQIGEDRPAMQRKLTGGHIEHVRAHHVRRHQIGGALHALKSEAADARERFHRQRFCQAGHAFHQRVAAADEHEKHLVDHFPLADDDFRIFAANVRGQA